MSNTTFGAVAPTRAVDGAYNLFRNKARPELLCAVPEDRCVPRFITADDWEYVRKLDARADRPPGFHERAARTGVRYNGFYLFQRTADETPAGEVGGDEAESDPARYCRDVNGRATAMRAGRLEGRGSRRGDERLSLDWMRPRIRPRECNCA